MRFCQIYSQQCIFIGSLSLNILSAKKVQTKLERHFSATGHLYIFQRMKYYTFTEILQCIPGNFYISTTQMAFSRMNGDLLKHTLYTPVQKNLLKTGTIFGGVKITPGCSFSFITSIHALSQLRHFILPCKRLLDIAKKFQAP